MNLSFDKSIIIAASRSSNYASVVTQQHFSPLSRCSMIGAVILTQQYLCSTSHASAFLSQHSRCHSNAAALVPSLSHSSIYGEHQMQPHFCRSIHAATLTLPHFTLHLSRRSSAGGRRRGILGAHWPTLSTAQKEGSQNWRVGRRGWSFFWRGRLFEKKMACRTYPRKGCVRTRVDCGILG